MSSSNGSPVRFSWLTALVWLLVAAGIIFVLWQVITRISASNLPGNLPVSSPTPNQTQVYQTIAAVLTAQPTSSSTATPETVTPSSTSNLTQVTYTPLPSTQRTSTPAGTLKTVTLMPRCDQAAAGNPIDVTIPDDSLIPAGQGFTKTWKLVNAGTCTWTTGYSASFFYGERMGAPQTVPLQATVLPAQSVEISIDMVAPLTPGTYQGNWKLSNPAGVLFGIGPNGDSPFWVRINVAVGQAATATRPAEITTTANPTDLTTPTPTPEGQVSGELSLIPGDELDLDALLLNNGNTDLLYQLDATRYHWLDPQDAAMIGVYGNLEPTRVDCQLASMSTAPIAVESLSIGTYLCYFTNEGRFGRALLETVDPDNFTLTMYLLTWALP
jgi:hypothetical protein